MIGNKLEVWDVSFAIEQYNYALTAQLGTPVTGSTDHSSVTAHITHLMDRLARLFHLRLTPQVATSDGSYRSDCDGPVFTVEDVDGGETAFGELVFDLFEK